MTPSKHSLEEEVQLQGTTGSKDSSTSTHPPPKKRLNAFTQLMSPKSTPAPTPSNRQPTSTLRKTKTILSGLDPRNGLGIYINTPETNPEGRIVSYDSDFVLIRDKFPKASVHLLLIPRREEYFFEHPLKILSTDAAFLENVRRRVEEAKTLAAQELRRMFGHASKADAPYQSALEALYSTSSSPATPTKLSALPSGRDWSSEIIAGVHTHPSMNHLHIHIFSRDMHSECMKHKKHYLSFNSSFLVQMDQFPLEEGSERFKPGDWPNWDMKCWRCGEGFGNGFKRLKEHLEGEFGGWVKE